MKGTDKILLSVCGAILLLTQFVAVREIGSTFFSTEIVTLLATITILIGPSIAYTVAPHLSKPLLGTWGCITFLSVVTLPYSIRWLAALSGKLENLVLLVIILSGGLVLSGFFAAFLPLRSNSSHDFKSLYTLELVGAVIGLALMAVLPQVFSDSASGTTFSIGWCSVLGALWFLVVAALHLAFNKTSMTIAASAMVIASIVFYPYLDRQIAQCYFEGYWKLKNPVLLETCYSPYQRIDVVQTEKGRCLFLDGIPYYDPGDLHWFNRYIAELPGQLICPKDKGKALVIGSGSLSSTRYLLDQGLEVTTIEIDREVARLGLKYFAKPDPRINLVYDDARHFLEKQSDSYYDLIVLDVPAPYHIQTALLFTPDFLKSAKRCLRADGILTINTCSAELTDETGSAIAAGAASVFEDVKGIYPNSVGLVLLYCSRKLPFDSQQLLSKIKRTDKRGATIYDDHSIRSLIYKRKPHDRDHLVALMVLSRWMLEGN